MCEINTEKYEVVLKIVVKSIEKCRRVLIMQFQKENKAMKAENYRIVIRY